MDKIESKLWDILGDARQGDPIAAEDYTFTENCLTHPDPHFRAMACEIFYRSDHPDEFKNRAFPALEQLCAQHSGEDFSANLLTFILQVPRPHLLFNPTLIAFVYRCAASEHWAARTNVTFALEEFARAGDPQAIPALKHLLTAEQSSAKNNAKVALANLAAEGITE